MNAFTPDIFRSVRHYAGKIRTLRNELRTVRFMKSLPDSIRKDIGLPDDHAAWRDRRS